MISTLSKKVKNFLEIGHERTLKIKKNIIYTFLIRGTSVLIGFMLLPLTIHYIDGVQYGIWITIASLVAWINTFDIGLSNGLRNKLAHSIAIDERENIVKDIANTYALLFIIASIFFISFFVVGSFFNWNMLFNIQKSINYDIWPIILIALGGFCLQFILQPINSILIATHQPFRSALILLIGQALTFILIFFLKMFTVGNLYILVIIASGSPVFTLLVAGFYLYKTSLKNFAPRFDAIQLKKSSGLVTTGGMFFFIQLGALILFETDNIVITKTLGPLEVTNFNIAFKYFSIITVAFGVIITPYWSAFTDAFAKNDFKWIKDSINKMLFVWMFFALFSILLYFLSATLYRLWIGENIVIPSLLSISLAVYVNAVVWNVIFAYLLNGIGKLRVELIMMVSTAVLNIPLSVFLIHRIGVSGTVIANIIVFLIMNVTITYQCKLILNKKAKGIWNM